MVDQIIFLAAYLCAIAYFSNREDGPHSLDQDSKDTSKQSESLDIPEIASQEPRGTALQRAIELPAETGYSKFSPRSWTWGP